MSQAGLATGKYDAYLPMPRGLRDEEFHTAITELLSDWGSSATVVPTVQIVSPRIDALTAELRDFAYQMGMPAEVVGPDPQLPRLPARDLRHATRPAGPQQAIRFGTRLFTGWPVESMVLDHDGEPHLLVTGGGRVRARAVVVASGVAYRRLGVDGVEGLVGLGVCTTVPRSAQHPRCRAATSSSSGAATPPGRLRCTWRATPAR